MMIPAILWHRTSIRPDLGKDRGTSDARRRARLRSRSQSAGYTLLELVIVLAIIGVLAAVSMPALMRPWSRSHVQQAAQGLSRDLLKARMDAIQYGTPYQFRSREQTGEYEIVAWQDASLQNNQTFEDRALNDRKTMPRSMSTEQAPPALAVQQGKGIDVRDRQMSALATDSSRQRRIIERLANDVIFVPDEPATLDPPKHRGLESLSRRPQVADPQPPQSNRDGLQPQLTDHHRAWKEPIWFFPDGRTSTAELVLRDADGYTVRLSLRGMTGTIRVGVVKKVEIANVPDGQPRFESGANPKPMDNQSQ